MSLQPRSPEHPNQQLHPMNHPAPEQWMEYLYQELPRQTRRSLNQHLGICPICREKVNSWRGVGQVLNAWKVPAKRSPYWIEQPWLKWGIAAMLVLGLGLLIGRLTVSTSPNREALRAELREQLRADFQAQWQAMLQKARQDLASHIHQQNQADLAQASAVLLEATGTETQRILTEFIGAYEAERQKEYRTLLTALGQWESQRLDDYALMRKDLETLALTTADQIHQARNQIGRLAAFTQPASGKNNNP